MHDVLAEPARVEALEALQVRATPLSEQPFAQVVATVADLFDMPNVAIHLLDDEHQWVKTLIGDKFECRIEESFCQYALSSEDDVWVIPDARKHALVHDHPLVTSRRIGFYAAATLTTREGHRVGTLCLTDPLPRENLSPRQCGLLRQFARIIIAAMEQRMDFHEVQSALTSATALDGVTGLPNTGSLLGLMHRLQAHSNPQSQIGLVQAKLVDTANVRQFAGESGLNQMNVEIARRLEQDLAEAERLFRTEDNDFLFVRLFDGDISETASESLETWAADRSAATEALLIDPVLVHDRPFYLTAQFGLATFEASAIDPAAAMDGVKIAAERAQKGGAESAVWYSPELSDQAGFLAVAEHGLREAVRARRFELAFQPVMCLETDQWKVCGAEALLRWPDQREPVLGPGEFIPMAEQKGLIGEIGLWVFAEACAALAQWQSRWPIWLSVNVSPMQFQDTSLPDKFMAIAAESGVSPQQLKLEITESALDGNFSQIRDMLIRLKEQGFRLALDDFGTGHSSLARIIHLPFDDIKVDRAFVSDAPGGPGAAVVSALANLTRELGMNAIAEGVETPEHERFLVQTGYRFAQGYRYARPLSGKDFEGWLTSQDM